MSAKALRLGALAIVFASCGRETPDFARPASHLDSLDGGPDLDTGSNPTDDSGTPCIGRTCPSPDSGGPSEDGGVPLEDGGPGPICEPLAACCPELPRGQRRECRRVAEGGDLVACQEILDRAHQQGFCGADDDAGPDDDGGPNIGPACNALDDCCDQIPPPLNAVCRSTVQGGSERACRQGLDLARQQGFCGAPPPDDGGTPVGGPACDALDNCCVRIPPPLDAVCRTTAQGGNEGICQQALGFARQQGFCGAPAPDGGPPIGGPACNALDSCCNQIGPPLDAACRIAAQTGNEGLCRQGLDLAHQQGFCAAPTNDAGTPVGGPACNALDSCCAQIGPPLDAVCRIAAQSGNEGICQQGLGLARQQGLCAAPTRDAGTPVGGPACSALDSCCNRIGPPLDAVCRATVQTGNEGICQQGLGLARQQGLCGGP